MENKKQEKKMNLRASIMLVPLALALLLGAAYAAITLAPLVQELGKSTSSTGATTREFNVDLVPIDVIVMMPPQSVGPTSHNMMVSFMAMAPITYMPLTCSYSLDNGASVPIPGCAPFTLVNVADGSHSIEVFAQSQNGEADSGTAQFAIDASSVPYPEPTITRLDAMASFSGNFTVEYVIALAPGTTAQSCSYSLDNSAHVPDPTCKGFEMHDLADGSHTLAVYVTDSAGISGVAVDRG
ncbi:MAG: hypothetical protein WC861_06295 [Candidatus Micrarchaeia archaeon]|jgi:hypothetical protein